MRLYCESLLNSPSAHLESLHQICVLVATGKQKYNYLIQILELFQYKMSHVSPFQHGLQLLDHFWMRLSQKLPELCLKVSACHLHLTDVDC